MIEQQQRQKPKAIFDRDSPGAVRCLQVPSLRRSTGVFACEDTGHLARGAARCACGLVMPIPQRYSPARPETPIRAPSPGRPDWLRSLPRSALSAESLWRRSLAGPRFETGRPWPPLALAARVTFTVTLPFDEVEGASSNKFKRSSELSSLIAGVWVRSRGGDVCMPVEA